jgi:hypothetical protein
LEEIIGVDFDGVLRKWPGFVSWYANFLSPQDILVRARLYFLRRILNNFFMYCLPVILDGTLIDSLNREEVPIIVISGRWKTKEVQTVKETLKPFLKVNRFCFRESPREPEHEFKERIIRQEHVTIFLDDRKFVVDYLRRKGITAFHINEIR